MPVAWNRLAANRRRDRPRLAVKRGGLRKDFGADGAVAGDGQGPALDVGDHRVRVDAEEMERGGEDVLGRDGRIADVAAVLIGAAHDAAAGDAATGESDR